MNVGASGIAADLISPNRFIIAPEVSREALFIYDDDERSRRIKIGVEFYGNAGLFVEVARMSTKEIERSIELAARVDDGEAQAIAIAEHRNLRLLTDDRAALRLCGELSLPYLTTPDLILVWARKNSIEAVRKVVMKLEARARFKIPKGHGLWSIIGDANSPEA